MLSIVSANQIPARKSDPYSQIRLLPLDQLKPGQAIRIPLEDFPPDQQSQSRAFGAIRSRIHRARKSTGLALRVQKADDAFYVTRVS